MRYLPFRAEAHVDTGASQGHICLSGSTARPSCRPARRASLTAAGATVLFPGRSVVAEAASFEIIMQVVHIEIDVGTCLRVEHGTS